jgi:four helix bundle protein
MRKYRSLIAWQRARELSLVALRATDGVPHRRAIVLDQLARAALSVELNIVEGYALGTRAQFRRHLRIAVGSAAETECAIDVARTLGWITDDTAEQLARLIDEVLACLHGLLRRLASST